VQGEQRERKTIQGPADTKKREVIGKGKGKKLNSAAHRLGGAFRDHTAPNVGRAVKGKARGPVEVRYNRCRGKKLRGTDARREPNSDAHRKCCKKIGKEGSGVDRDITF